MNDQYKLFQSLWVSYDELSILIGVISALLLLLTTLSYHLHPCPPSPALFLTRALLFLISLCTPYPIPLLFLCYLPEILQLRACLPFRLPTPSYAHLALLFSLIAYFDQSFSDSLLQEGDYLVDFLLLFLLCSLFLSGSVPAGPFCIYITCMKLSYFSDRQESMNSKVDERLTRIKEMWPALHGGVVGMVIVVIEGVRGVVGVGVAAVWVLGEGEARDAIAKGVYIVSLLHLIYELTAAFLRKHSLNPYNILSIVLKPLLLVSGADL
jgi:hypothetical protein